MVSLSNLKYSSLPKVLYFNKECPNLYICSLMLKYLLLIKECICSKKKKKKNSLHKYENYYGIVLDFILVVTFCRCTDTTLWKWYTLFWAKGFVVWKHELGIEEAFAAPFTFETSWRSVPVPFIKLHSLLFRSDGKPAM